MLHLTKILGYVAEADMSERLHGVLRVAHAMGGQLQNWLRGEQRS